MKLQLALYDPACQAEDGSYWSWKAPGLEAAFLDDCYYRAIRQVVPVDEKTLRDSRLAAGYLKLAKRAVYFRVVDGGHDRQNRPGRFVVICAVVNSGAKNHAEGAPEEVDLPAIDLEAIWRCPLFERVAETARRRCPVPPPEELEIEIEPAVARDGASPPAAALEAGGQRQWRNDAPWTQFHQQCRSLPQGEWRATLILGSEEQLAEIGPIESPPRSHAAASAVNSSPTSGLDAQSPSRSDFSSSGRSRPKWRRILALGSLLLFFVGVPAAYGLKLLLKERSAVTTTIDAVESLVIRQVSRIDGYDASGRLDPKQRIFEVRFQLPKELARVHSELDGEIELLDAGDGKKLPGNEPVVDVQSLSEALSRFTDTPGAGVATFRKFPKGAFQIRITLRSGASTATPIESQACRAL